MEKSAGCVLAQKWSSTFPHNIQIHLLMFYIYSKHKSPFPVALCKEKRWHEKLASAAAAVKGLLKFQIRPMEMCPSGCCRGKSGLLAYSVSSIYISTVSGIWSIYSLGYLHNIWWTADTGSGQGDLVHALSDNLHPSWLLGSDGLCIWILLQLRYVVRQ